ncbi:MAG: SDR family oxidoreductase [Actinobacteria bacterium]|nr:SDR family oxidoreductase [Actinomycetota bacterium]
MTTLERALVTGASSGLGAEFARQLAARGLDLVLVARRAPRLRELAAAIERDHGVEVDVHVADLVDPDGLAGVETRLASGTDPVDLLVNNAGFGQYGGFVDVPVGQQEEQIELNVLAVMRLTRAILPRLVAVRSGGVINIASIAALQPGPYGAVYAATKAWVKHFTEAIHEELRGTGVRALAVCPGIVETEFQQVAGLDASVMPSFLRSDDAAAVVRESLEAFRRDRAVVVPGAVNKLAAAGSKLTPHVISARMAAEAHRRQLDR